MENPKIRFEGLIVYQKSLDSVDEVYDSIETFPKAEIYRLTSQFVRASTSTASNISEGSSTSDAGFNRYLQIAINSV